MDSMMTDLCQYLKNWFDTGCAVYEGTITIAGGTITCARNLFSSEQVPLEDGQYFRIQGSTFDDGVHIYPDTEMDCTFEGVVTPMRVPYVVTQLATEIQAWRDKNEAVDSQAMSPYTSESFAGYSYNKGATDSNASSGWQGAYKNRLSHWRKI